MTSQSRPGWRALGLEERVYLDLLRTCEVLTRRIGEVLKAEDLSSTQYNVLRILRGAPDGLPYGEIGNRVITRDPDITRLLDRLEKRDLISRWRLAEDRPTGGHGSHPRRRTQVTRSTRWTGRRHPLPAVRPPGP